MKNRIRLRTQVARVGACLALLNFAVPGGALVSFGVPAREAIGKALAARAAAARDLAARRKKSASRLLTEKEERTMQGRTGENPYLAGQAKWDVTYKGIDLMTGNYATSATDMSFDGGYGIPVNITRSYSANAVDEGPFGKGWTLSADVRSTAGGLLKSPAAPVQAIPTTVQERNDAETDPNVAVQPAQAVTAVDAGGTAETVAKDVDGILTTPAWDNNVYNSQYQWVTLNGQSYQVLVSNTTVTTDGTTYAYAQEGSYPYGTVPYNNPGATPQAANVLKVTTATDRQGNVTTYTYGSGTVSFQKSDGTTVEHPLTGVSMPGGHVITLTWGTNANAASYERVTSISDGPGGRTVTYAYTGQPGHGLLASVTTPGGKTTSYGYGSPWVGSAWQGDVASSLLTTITDPRGLTTTVEYAMAYVSLVQGTTTGPVAYRVTDPNGVVSAVFYGSFAEGGGGFDGGGGPAGAWCPPDIAAGGSSRTTPYVTPTYAYVTQPDGLTPVSSSLFEFLSSTNGSQVVTDVNTFDRSAGGAGSSYLPAVQRTFDPSSENLMEERDYSYPGFTDDLAQGRGLQHFAYTRQYVTTDKTYNFMGNPLRATTTESVVSMPPYQQTTVTRTATTDTCYWDASKYYQKKATQDQAGRYTYTDYYPNTASAGKRGQTYQIFDPKNGGITLNTNAPLPSYATSATAWRYQVTPAAGQYSAQFDYDSQGRSIDAWKLQSTATSPWTYVRTHSTYGGDGAPSWGQASQAVEDYGGIGRTTTTHAYTSWGKACDVVDAAGHEFVTSFDPDGLVQSVTRTDGGQSQTIVSYGYGSSGVSTGQPTSISDGLSGVAQTIVYTPNGGGVGSLASVTETNGGDSYTVSYAYDAYGNRSMATYATPSGTRSWGYADYLYVGDPTNPTQAFQTLRRLDGSGNPTSEEMQYAYDGGGRLQTAAFAQTPYLDSSGNPYAPSAGAPYYDAGHLASARAVALYTYDAGGRLTDLATNWQALPNGGGSYATTGLAENACAYEVNTGLNRGLKTSGAFTMLNIAGNGYDSRTESYGYDASLDYLTSANYGDGNPGATPTWSYDAAGNRNDAVVDSLDRATSLGGVAATSDALGNRLTLGGASYGWDCLNRLTSLSGSVTASYEYRADGLRVGKQTGGVTTQVRYDCQMPVEDVETGSSGTTLTRFGIGARGVDLIERTDPQGNVVTGFPIYDAHGNDVATLTRSGSGYAIGDRRSYDAWGVVRSQQSAGDPKLRYCGNLGHKQDDESSLVYMRARYYEPTSGRFLSEDPSQQGLNWFSYCSNNPVSMTDSAGRMSNVAEFALSCLLFFIGYVILLNGVVPDLATKIANITYRISKYVDKIDQMTAVTEDVREAMRARQEILEASRMNAQLGRAVGAIAGYAMVCAALLLDIDLVGSNFDMLQSFYGGN